MQLVDLSHSLASGMPVYPGDPKVRVERALSIADDLVEVHSLHLGTHSGTHLDAPSHTVPRGRTVDEVNLDEVVGSTLVIGCPPPGGNGLISWASIADRVPPQVPPRVFFATGWDAHWGSPELRSHPGLAPELVEQLWDRGMRLLGIDCLSPDPTGGESLPVHDIVLGQDGLIVENLAGLTPFVGQVIDAAVVPMAWDGLDGSPVRAWARIP